MIATYRLQLTPNFGFAEVQALLPYLGRLGVSHLYLSPITQARQGSSHGYDVTDHNQIREAFGGADGFEALRAAAEAQGFSLILDFVPNHAGVGSRNAYWQDVLAYGPHSAYAHFFDIDWHPLKPELERKILLPFLGSPYGEVLDGGELKLSVEKGHFYANYYDNRFALSPTTFALILVEILPAFERTEHYFDLKDLLEAYTGLEAIERDKAEGLSTRLSALAEQLELTTALEFPPEHLHPLLERQFWRLAYWKTAGDEINYRRFFDINELVGLRMEDSDVFWNAHQLAGELVVKEAVTGLRIDHIDGLFDPQGYLERLTELGARQVWVEKILASGETLPESWLTAGTTGYEFLNDVMGVLTYPAGERPLKRAYHRFVEDALPYEEEVHRSKRLVMDTSLSGELTRLAGELDRLSEADYHTRDFTLEALREALAEIIASFPRYRTYLPHGAEEAREVIAATVRLAERRNLAFETSVYRFIEHALVGELREDLQEQQRAFIGRFQQYTAPVAAKGVEDTAFYRYLPLVALNEVGGEPAHFGVAPQAFHARARFRAYRYPHNLLTTATHDHKRGEDTRMRLIVLAELAEDWEATVNALSQEAERYRITGLELEPLSHGPSSADEYLFYQLLAALWVGANPEHLADRLVPYLQKAAREAKLRSSWLNPNEAYETALESFVRGMMADDRVVNIIEPLARSLARYSFSNSLSQLILKLTTPGVPDIYQGNELLDLTLVDPDNRQPVDYGLREELLEILEPLQLDREEFTRLLSAQDERLKLLVTSRLLRLRREHQELFAGDYRALEPEGTHAEHLLAFTREAPGSALLVVVPRFPATLEAAGGWADTHLTLPDTLKGREWTEQLSGERLSFEGVLEPGTLPLPFAVLLGK